MSRGDCWGCGAGCKNEYRAEQPDKRPPPAQPIVPSASAASARPVSIPMDVCHLRNTRRHYVG